MSTAAQSYKSLWVESKALAQRQIEHLEKIIDKLETERVLPLVTFGYPTHGRGQFTTRFVRVTSMDDSYIKGFEIESEYDTEPGKPKTYILDKIRNVVTLLRVGN